MVAVRVRRVRPYNLLISEATEVIMPCFAAISCTIFSSLRLSTPKALEATRTVAPWSLKILIAFSTLISLTSLSLRNV